MLSVLLYEHAVAFTLLSRLHPYIVMFITFFPAYIFFNIRIEYTAVIGAVFFAGVLRKNLKFVPGLTTQLWMCTIPIVWIITAYFNSWIGLFLQLLLDYLIYPKSIYLHKTWNRIFLFVLLVVVETNEALILTVAVGHGILLHYLYGPEKKVEIKTE